MPTTRRRDIVADRRLEPAAVLTLIGAYDFVVHGYRLGNTIVHIEGPPGPRGGRKTFCGRGWNSYWGSRTLAFPLPPQTRYWNRDQFYWRNTCTECRAALGATLNG